MINETARNIRIERIQCSCNSNLQDLNNRISKWFASNPHTTVLDVKYVTENSAQIALIYYKP